MNILHNSVNIKPPRKENFPVASLLIPKHLREAIMGLYQFARSLDDIADHASLTVAEKKEQIAVYENELNKIAQQQPTDNPLFQALNAVVKKHALPLAPLYHLLNTLKNDIDFVQPNRFEDLLAYCEGSANTIGDIFLHLFNAYSPALKQQSDGICTALQLIDCWQDISDDLTEGRVYLPKADMQQYGVTQNQIAEKQFTAQWQQLMQQQLQRTHDLLLQGASLPLHLSGRIGWEIRLMVIAGFTLLHKLEKAHGNSFHHAPRLSAIDWLYVLWQSLRYKTIIEQEKNKTIDCS